MSPNWRQQLADYIRAQAQPVDKFSHQPRLYALACELAEGFSLDDDILYAACWLHDLGVFIGHRPEDPAQLATWDNVAYAIAQTPPLLQRFGFPPEKIPAVQAAIRDHHPQAPPPPSRPFCYTMPICWSCWVRSVCCEPSARWGAIPATKPLPICCRCWKGTVDSMLNS